MRTLFLSEKEVKELLTMKEAIESVESAFKEKGKGEVQMPPKTYIFLEEYQGDFRVMPAYVRRLCAAGVKIVNVHPNNPTTCDLPTVMATMILLDPKNGAPISFMDAKWITSMRTGAAGGIAVKHLARKDSRVVGLVGAGVQARFQLVALREVLPEIEEVRVADKIKACSERCAKEMAKRLELNVRAVESDEQAVRGADIIVTVTPVRSPIVMDEWIDPGTHINAMGADAPGKEELDPMILKRAKIVIDDWDQAVHSGEVNVPISKGVITREDIYGELGEIVCGKKEGRTSPDEITIFDSTGLAIQDVATAWTIYQRAKDLGVGKYITLF